VTECIKADKAALHLLC